MHRFIVISVIIAFTGCTSSMDYADSPNFNPKTKMFQNSDSGSNDKSLSELIDLAKEFSKREKDQTAETGFPVTYRDQNGLSNFSESVIWLGQSTILLNHHGLNVVTDPHFSKRASPMSFLGPKRITPNPITINDLPEIDIVLISHNHYDHLDKTTIKELINLQPSIKYLVPLGLADMLRSWGVTDVTELDWWQPIKFQGVKIQPTPVKHWSKRTFFDRNKSLWSGWMLKWDDFSFYFAGDSGYSKDFKETAERLGAPTLAAIPIGAYAPRDFMKEAHMNPEEAVKVFKDLGAKYAVAVHWGTFKLTTEKMNEPLERLLQSLKDHGIASDKFRALQHGEIWEKPFSN